MRPPRSGRTGPPPFHILTVSRDRWNINGHTVWQHWPVTRMTRQTTKAMTRQRLLGEAERLFRERGYAATSLEQIAEAAGVTKGAIYGHFSSKEDLLISAIEAAPIPAWATGMNDQSLPLRERLAEFSRPYPWMRHSGTRPCWRWSLSSSRRCCAARMPCGATAPSLSSAGGAGRGRPRTAAPRDRPRRSLGHRPRTAHRIADLPEHRAGHPHPRGVRACLRATRRSLSRGLSGRQMRPPAIAPRGTDENVPGFRMDPGERCPRWGPRREYNPILPSTR